MAHNGKKNSLEDRDFKVDSRFVNLKPIGFGGNGIVYSAVDSECEKEVAIKKICFSDKKTCKYAFRELRIMRRLHHENIVTVYEVLGAGVSSVADSNLGSLCELNSVYIVQELLDTDLQQLLVNEGCSLSEEHARLFLYQLLRGLKYIHSANILHRDLKPSNLLINLDLTLKIGDFGLARVIDSDYTHKGFLTDQIGTCWYRSPELIISPNDYTKAIDIWSAGCIFVEMLTGRPLLPGSHDMEQISLILQLMNISDNEWNKVTQVLPKSVMNRIPRYPEKSLHDSFPSVEPLALNLIEKMLTVNSSQRISAEEALQHPYLKSYYCPYDEPVATEPFFIEHEVDEISPKALHHYITKLQGKSTGYEYLPKHLNIHTDYIQPDSPSPDSTRSWETQKSKKIEKNTESKKEKNKELCNISNRHQSPDTTNHHTLKKLGNFKRKKSNITESFCEMKVKDRVNLERKSEQALCGRRMPPAASHKEQLIAASEADSIKYAAEKNQCEKKLYREKSGGSNDFDSRYRLPTEHLTRQNKSLSNCPSKMNPLVLASEFEKIIICDEENTRETTQNHGRPTIRQKDFDSSESDD
ncbi:mitogen-activated protein kinase 10-like [Argonauta hians]